MYLTSLETIATLILAETKISNNNNNNSKQSVKLDSKTSNRTVQTSTRAKVFITSTTCQRVNATASLLVTSSSQFRPCLRGLKHDRR